MPQTAAPRTMIAAGLEPAYGDMSDDMTDLLHALHKRPGRYALREDLDQMHGGLKGDALLALLDTPYVRVNTTADDGRARYGLTWEGRVVLGEELTRLDAAAAFASNLAGRLARLRESRHTVPDDVPADYDPARGYDEPIRMLALLIREMGEAARLGGAINPGDSGTPSERLLILMREAMMHEPA